MKYKGFIIEKVGNNFRLHITKAVYSDHDSLQEAQAVAKEIIDSIDRWDDE